MKGREISRTFNEDYIRYMAWRVWPDISEQGALLEEFTPDVDRDSIRWYTTEDEVSEGYFAPVGLWMVHQRYASAWQIHVMIMPEFWGGAHEYSRKAVDYIFQDTGAETLIAECPASNPAVYKHALKVGFKDTGTIPRAFYKDGKLYHVNILTAHRRT